MRFLFIFFLVISSSAVAQDTVISTYPTGAVHRIQYNGESMRTRRDQKLPVRIVYNQDSTIDCELYYELLKPKRRIWYENNIPVFGESGHCHNYFFEKGELVRKTTRNRFTRISVNCENDRKPQQYSVERGTFKNFILKNGTISYYTVNDELTTTIEVRDGYRKNDGVIYFKDSSLYRQIRNMPNRTDLNENLFIELSEASCIKELVIRSYVRDFSALRYFTNLESIEYLGNRLTVSDFASFSSLSKKLMDTKRVQTDRRGYMDIEDGYHTLEDIVMNPISCQCAQSDLRPVATTGNTYDFVEYEAQFVGGPELLKQWLDSNQIVSDHFIPNGKAKVYVSFIVEIDGAISSAKIIRGLNETVDSEVIRLIASMPKWIPAKNDGLDVRSRMRLPIGITSNPKTTRSNE